MSRLVRVLVAAAGAALIAGAPAAGAATAPWETSLSIDANPASIQALSLTQPGALLAAGGRNVAGTYDQPTVWRYRNGGWRAERLPVDLTSSWGYASAVSQTVGDEWAGGWTTNQSSGAETPFVAHRSGGHWGIVSRQWLDPTDGQGAVAAIVTRGPQDVWVVVNEGGYFESLTSTAVWHFDGRFWGQEPAMPVRNNQCSPGYGLTVTSAAATSTDLIVAANCQTSGFKSAGLVERFDRHHWHRVAALPSGTGVYGVAADAGGTIWAVGGAAGGGGLAGGAAWSGDASGLSPVYVPAPSQSILQSVAFDNRRVVMAGEAAGGFGPAPLLISRTHDGTFRLEGLPYDRELSAVVIGAHGRLWVSGPVFGGWLGGDLPHAAVLTRDG